MILFIITYYIYFIYRSMEAMHMLQQNLYNENNRYIKWLVRNKKRIFNYYDLVPILFFAFIYIVKDQTIIDFTVVASLIVYMYGIYNEYKKNKESQNKIPLKGTNRIKRLFIMIVLLYSIPAIPLLRLQNNLWVATLLIISVIMIFFIYYVVYIAMLINTPFDKLEMLYFISKAKNKLKSYNNLIVVGITGSYGKTSSKNILNDILSTKYIVRKSPQNFNTLKGLTITINNYLDKFDEVFIAEMGAYVPLEIKEICGLVKPRYGILTVIGEAHLETFKSRENIQKAKFELIESLDPNGLAILNHDDPYQREYKLKNPVKVMWIGIDNKESNMYATNISYDNHGMKFDCIYGDECITLSTKLLGKHNVYNILAAVLLARNLNVSWDDIKTSVKMLKQTPHRLELKKIGGFYQLDDAYNSNPIGAHNALEILSFMDGVKCVVTPGMIELGSAEKEKNYQFGREIKEVAQADYAILIGKKRTKDIYEGLIDAGFDKDKIIILNRVVDSYRYISSLTSDDKKVYALYENDLPDIYTEEE